SNVTTSDTVGGAAGPTSTTDRTASGSVDAGTSTANGVSTATAPSAGALPAPNPNRVPNEMGRIMVLEYHLITDHNGLYARERGQFRKDLELLYNRGYRPVNMADVLDKNLNLPKGISPVVFVFDDASPEQFRYIENNGRLEIDPTSRIGIGIDSAVPGYKPREMALPQGLWPKNRALASHGSWTDPKTRKTVTYSWPVVFEVDGGPMRSPYDPAFNPGSTPRIQVIGNAIES